MEGSKREQIARRAARQETGAAAVAPEGMAARLRAARVLRRTVRFPGTSIPIAVQVLSAHETAEAQAAALLAARELGIDDSKPGPNHIEQLGVMVVAQVLARALYEPDLPGAPRLFSSPDDLTQAVTTDELHALHVLYLDACQALDPRPEDLPEEQLEAFVEAAKKKAVTHWRALVSSWPRSWLLSLADQHASSLSSSSSTSASDSPSESDDSDEMTPAAPPAPAAA